MPKTNVHDFFPNIDLVNSINCPIFIIHGTKDKVIPISHGQQMYGNSKKKYTPWFVENGGHNNIDRSLKFKGKYYEEMKNFIKKLTEL
jgi:dipeptidyl aminopeptidase/acylaminoacyl peptidase